MSKPAQQTSECNRRDFLGNSARNAAGVAAGVFSLGISRSSTSAQENCPVRVGIIGAGAQGTELAGGLANVPGVRIQAVCDVDIHAAAKLQHLVQDRTGASPILVSAHEAILDRRDVDAVVIATPDHWHARMAVDVCQSGKDLYLEQPVAHTLTEGRQIRLTAERTGRVIQTGLPQRSGAHFQSAVALLQSGELGRIHQARAWAVHRRRSLGRVATAAIPPGVDYDRWLGPASQRPFQQNRFQTNWPWFWDYGSGELGLWGVQLLDVVRWGLGLALPTRVAAFGGQRGFRDDRETPDTLTVQYEFPGIDVSWEHRLWSNRGIEGRPAACAFYGDRGTLVVDRSGWKVYDGRDGLYADASEIKQTHLQNWIDCIRTRQAPAAPLRVGEASTALCHLGNIAYRLGREINFDAQNWNFGTDHQANALLAVTMRSPWQITEG